MPAPVLVLSSTVTCAHLGKGQPSPLSPKLKINGEAVALLTTQYTITGCTLPAATSGGSPPCLTGTFTVGATKVTSDAQPLLIVGSTGTSVPNGTPMITAPSQPKIVAT
jgi:hypothetical protein